MRSAALVVTLALVAAGCAGARAPAPADAARPGEAAVLRAAELARVRCLLVAPFENASDAPLADAATGAILSGVDPARARVYPVPELRALFRDTPLELPEGVSPSLALELAEILGADAALYGAVEGRAREAEPDLVVTLRLALAGHRDLVYAASAPVRPAPGERPEAAVRRTARTLAEPVLAKLGDLGRKRCFDPERTKAVRAAVLADARAAEARAVPPAVAIAPAQAAVAPPPAPSPAAKPAVAAAPRARTTPRQSEWAKRLAGAGRVAAEDVTFAGRTAELQRDAGLADLAAALAAAPRVKVRVEAFVDTTSSPEGDAKLSAAMAQAALHRLVQLGVARDRLSWAGRGGESPILPNFTARGRAANRRVEVVGLP
jgi:outer membrane protein OmpA-like peptidoglycan-associated protein